uniref:KR domain-containing protein n=1 Tax=Heterorhabditis bacteriophora TaxID=37862 RepID=A0A1I7X7Y0_HETBA
MLENLNVLWASLSGIPIDIFHAISMASYHAATKIKQNANAINGTAKTSFVVVRSIPSSTSFFATSSASPLNLLIFKYFLCDSPELTETAC